MLSVNPHSSKPPGWPPKRTTGAPLSAQDQRGCAAVVVVSVRLNLSNQ